MNNHMRRAVIGPFTLAEVLAGGAGLAAVTASLAGFIPGLYRDRAVVIPQTHGYDVGNLVAAAFLGIGLLWSARGSARGRLVAIGSLACLVYSYVTYAFLIVLNPATLLYVAVLSLAAWSVAAGLLRFDASELEPALGRPLLRRATGAFLFAVVALFAVNWLRQIGAALISGRLPSDLAANGWPMNPVWVEDLGFALPLMGLAGVWLFMRRKEGVEIALAMLVFMPLLAVTILSMAASMAIAGQTLDMALVGIFGTLVVVSTAFAIAWLRGPRVAAADERRTATLALQSGRKA